MKFDYFDMLSGEPITVAGVGRIKSPRVKDIYPETGIGHEMYNVYLNFISWDKESMIKYFKVAGERNVGRLEKVKDKFTNFDMATILPRTRSIFMDVFSFFIVEKIGWDDSSRTFKTVDGDEIVGEINRDNFDEIRKIILKMNYIGLEKKDVKPKASSESAKKLWDKAQKFLKQQADGSSKGEHPEYSLGNIISKLCVLHPSYNLLNVLDLTVFQLYDSFFQIAYMRSTELGERIFSIHGGDKFKFDDWLKPIMKI